MNDTAPATKWHSLDAEACLRELKSDPVLGLSRADAQTRLGRYGKNDIATEERRGLLALIATQLLDVMIVILLVAAIVSGILGELRDTLAIVVIVALNAIVGATQEYRAQRTLTALRKLSALKARVLRDGTAAVVPATTIVPGDIVLIAAGDIVPADLRLLDSAELTIDEAVLTGESLPVLKDRRRLDDDKLALGDRRNICFRSTSVTKGNGKGIVVATGGATEFGRIADLLASRRDTRTPLQQRLAVFGRRLALAILGICALIFALGWLGGQAPMLMFLTAVSLAVAAIPEALPAVVTVSLAIGAKALSRNKSLVRRLPAVEALGSVTYICTDKTGTLTENRMSVEAIFAAGEIAPELSALPEPIKLLVGRAFALCNGMHDSDDAFGDPTESAIVDAARSAGFDKRTLLAELPEIAVLAFDPERKLMTTVHRAREGAIAFSKGAPEQILASCSSALDARGESTPLDRDETLRVTAKLARQGHRLLGVAMRNLGSVPASARPAEIETDMIFLGLAALADPVRPEVPAAIADCLAAGVVPIMVTGDHPDTARHIAMKLGLADEESTVLTGIELARLSDRALAERLSRTRVFARVSPEQKIRIVESLQRAGEFVAMTGDGVNDAPALKQASIGVAMGGRGTDVAREAADLVLLDDNFATIVAAIREGRRVYDNIRKFIRYTLTSNSGEIWVLLLASLLGLPVPLLPIHILWINLVTDGLPGLAYSAEPEERDIMRRPPRPPQESVFAHGMIPYIFWIGLLIGVLSLATAARPSAGDLPYWQTMVFVTLVTAQLFQALAVRSESQPLWAIGLFSNRYMAGAVLFTLIVQIVVIYVPVLNTALRTTPLAVQDLLTCLALALLVLPAVELAKWLQRRRT